MFQFHFFSIEKIINKVLIGLENYCLRSESQGVFNTIIIRVQFSKDIKREHSGKVKLHVSLRGSTKGAYNQGATVFLFLITFDTIGISSNFSNAMLNPV